jgi:hypothetical protein
MERTRHTRVGRTQASLFQQEKEHQEKELDISLNINVYASLLLRKFAALSLEVSIGARRTGKVRQQCSLVRSPSRYYNDFWIFPTAFVT